MLKRLLPRRLDRQIMLLASLVLGLTMPTFALYEAADDAARTIEAAKLQAKALAENISVTSVEHILTQDFSSTEQLLLRSARFPGVVDIQVTDGDGRVIGDVVVMDGQPTLRYDITKFDTPSGSVPHLLQQERRLTVWEPIVGANIVGWVRLNYSLEAVLSIAREHLNDYLVDGLVMTLLLLALILLVMRRPLQMLRDAAEFAGQLKDKRGGRMVVDRGSIEIEQLAVALNTASANLFDQEVAIKKAMQELRTQKSAMDEHSIVSITDTEGRITYANQKFLDATEYGIEELLGQTHSIVKSDYHDDQFFKNMWEVISSGSVWHGEIKNRSKSGKDLWVNTTIVPFMDESGEPYEYVAIRTDVTQQKLIEKELEEKAHSLKNMTDHLEDMVKQRTLELEQANIQLRHLNRIKSEFVSVVSHELRTPLTSIKSFAEIMRDDIEELDVASQKRFLSIINEESERLGRLISDLLDLQKMDSGKMTWKSESEDLVELLRRTIEIFSQTYRDKGLYLEFFSGVSSVPVTVDVDRIKQVFTNILSNALKFTDHGGVKVTLSKGSNNVSISFVDTGVGIPESELDKIFESFHQVDGSETRKIGGSGLGLAICKEILEYYGGSISVTSVVGKGSCFTVELPRSVEVPPGKEQVCRSSG